MKKNYKELNERILEVLFPEGEKIGYLSLEVIGDIPQLQKDLKSEGYASYIENDRLIVENKEECL